MNSHKFINTIFSDIYTIKSTSLSQIYQHNFPTYIRINQQVSHKFISTIFLTYIQLNQQVTVSQKSFHNRLNNESFTHIQKKLKYLLRRRSQGREGGNMLNKHLHSMQKNI